MKDAERMKNANAFVQYWKDKGDEKQETQRFWIDLLSNVYGVSDPTKYIEFEKRVQLKSQSYIDGYIKDVKVLIEQKGANINIDKKEKQSDGTELTPYEQAKRYADDLPLSEKPRWIIVCNFQRFDIYDMEKSRNQRMTATIQLQDLPKDYSLMSFLVDDHVQRIKREEEISFKAGELVGKIYDALVKQYKFIDEKDSNKNPTERADAEQKSLNKLCVRIVFCLYAEDAGLFMKPNQFREYLEAFKTGELRKAIIDLFEVLNQKETERNPYLEDILNDFPYVNGGLFADPIEVPQFTDEIKDVLVNHACDFDWKEISPTIFGAVFESTLNPETRRSGGMHYTSIENIHKVIDPLFLDDLKEELADIKTLKQGNAIERRTMEYQKKLASLKFLDPAAGSGNFLTESYISLRRLENEAIEFREKGKIALDLGTQLNPIKVSISQFYGIEINDFAVTVARTALWIAEHQMMKETEKIILFDSDFLPLKSYAHIVEGNALRMDWKEVVDPSELNYIMGNPPFCGRRYRTKDQIEDVAEFFKYKDIDYVACWFKKAGLFSLSTCIRVAFVATNSITQGEQVPALWDEMFNEFGLEINFAYRTFRWDSEASIKAHVHCVIIGFSNKNQWNKKKILYLREGKKEVNNINGYLCDAPNVTVKIHSTPLCDVPKMRNGNVPLDGDALKIEENELKDFKGAEKYIKKLIGGRELLHNEKRYVLWLIGANPNDLKAYPMILNRINLCRNNRLAMKDKGTQKLAEKPMQFRDTFNPDTYIALPMVSSEKRKYIPMAYFDGSTISTNQVQIIPEATVYHFGVLESIVHMSWMRTVAGRLEMRYRYSKDIVYNNFPWPTPTDEQKKKIEQTAQAILDARELYPDASLADMYGEYMYLYPELVKAHEANDKAVMQAYGFKPSMSESEIVAELMKMYQQLVEAEKQ